MVSNWLLDDEQDNCKTASAELLNAVLLPLMEERKFGLQYELHKSASFAGVNTQFTGVNTPFTGVTSKSAWRAANEVHVEYCSTDDMITDYHTKPLTG
jgi:hypothetical protein